MTAPVNLTPEQIIELKNEIVDLELELRQATKDKKDVTSAHNENIKRIKAELSEKLVTLSSNQS